MMRYHVLLFIILFIGAENSIEGRIVGRIPLEKLISMEQDLLIPYVEHQILDGFSFQQQMSFSDWGVTLVCEKLTFHKFNSERAKTSLSFNDPNKNKFEITFRNLDIDLNADMTYTYLFDSKAKGDGLIQLRNLNFTLGIEVLTQTTSDPNYFEFNFVQKEFEFDTVTFTSHSAFAEMIMQDLYILFEKTFRQKVVSNIVSILNLNLNKAQIEKRLFIKQGAGQLNLTFNHPPLINHTSKTLHFDLNGTFISSSSSQLSPLPSPQPLPSFSKKASIPQIFFSKQTIFSYLNLRLLSPNSTIIYSQSEQDFTFNALFILAPNIVIQKPALNNRLRFMHVRQDWGEMRFSEGRLVFGNSKCTVVVSLQSSEQDVPDDVFNVGFYVNESFVFHILDYVPSVEEMRYEVGALEAVGLFQGFQEHKGAFYANIVFWLQEFFLKVLYNAKVERRFASLHSLPHVSDFSLQPMQDGTEYYVLSFS